VFCFFANSVKLLPEGFFPKLLKRAGQRPDKAQEYFNALFEAMEHGGEFDLTDIAHFNGGLFDGRRAIELDDGDIGLLVEAVHTTRHPVRPPQLAASSVRLPQSFRPPVFKRDDVKLATPSLAPQTRTTPR